MILSTATLTGVTAAPSLVEDIDFFLGTDSSSYPLAAKLRNINLAYYDVATVILAANSNWEWDDTNKTDFPIGTATMIAGQKDYTLPSDFVKIIRIEVKDAGGAWHKLEQFDETQIQGIGLTEFMESTGMPQYYREIGVSYELYPAPSAAATTLVSGVKVYFQRTPTQFTNADAAVSPGFSPLFHRVLSVKAAYDYAFLKTLPIAVPLKGMYEDFLAKISFHYANRNREVRPRLKVKYRNYE